jgi:hypothetical protein
MKAYGPASRHAHSQPAPPRNAIRLMERSATGTDKNY